MDTTGLGWGPKDDEDGTRPRHRMEDCEIPFGSIIGRDTDMTTQFGKQFGHLPFLINSIVYVISDNLGAL